jgi:Tfp pilus assembly ATPase PilU
VTNARVAELIRERRTEEIPTAIAEGEFFQMQTFSTALIDLVLEGLVDRETAANAATNRHDFELALEHALKSRAAQSAAPDDGETPVEHSAPREPEPEALGGLRLAQ